MDLEQLTKDVCQSTRAKSSGADFLCEDTNNLVIQGVDQPPIKKETRYHDSEGGEETMKKIKFGNISEGGIRLDLRDSTDNFSEEIVKRIHESGSIVKNFVTLKDNDEYGSTNYYEAVSRAGDDYLIELPKQSKQVQIFSEKDGVSSKYTETAAKIVSINNPPNDDCADDPVCSSIFKCNPLGKSCEAKSDVSLITFTKIDIKKEGISIGNFAGRRIGVPIIQYTYLLSNLNGITKTVAEVSQFIISTAIDSSMLTLNGVSAVFETRSREVVREMESIKNAVIKAKDANEETTKIIQAWDKLGSTQDDDYVKYKSMVAKRIEYKEIINSIFNLSDMYRQEIDNMIKEQFQFTSDVVKMWMEYMLHTSGNNGKSTFSSWHFFEAMLSMNKLDIINYIVGVGEQTTAEQDLQKKVMNDAGLKSFVKDKFNTNEISEEQFEIILRHAFKKDVAFFVTSKAKMKFHKEYDTLRTDIVLKKKIDYGPYYSSYGEYMKELNKNNRIAATLLEKLRAYIAFKGIALKIGPILGSKLDRLKEESKDMPCPEGKHCADFTNDKVSEKMKGNLSVLGNVKTSDGDYALGSISMEVDRLIQMYA